MSLADEPPAGEAGGEIEAKVRTLLGTRTIVMVGMMGAGKTSLGKRLAARLQLPFLDADAEIETAANATIPEIFDRYGEPYFREGERKVIHRLLNGEPKVLATGGGAYMNADTRADIAAHGVAVWLQADIDVLLARVKRRNNRPLLNAGDPEETLKRLINERYPVYAEAPIHVHSRDVAHEAVVGDILQALAHHLAPTATAPPAATESAGDHGALTLSTATLATKPAPTIVPVELGERSYEIMIGAGLLGSVGRVMADRFPRARAAIVTDSNVRAHHMAALLASLDVAGVKNAAIEVTPGESSKSYATLQKVVEGILAGRFERGDIVLAFGGGVVGDLAGFAASIVRRGMRFIQLPTSLLAQVDSSVGGKTGINSAHGKNLVGAFHQPSLVIADTTVLDTLPKREFLAGYAEIAKYGLINDAAFFAWLEKNWPAVMKGGSAERVEAIATSCRAKAAIVAADEYETGDRALLNLGHTFGHALEAATGYSDRLIHGEGVSIGMVLAHAFSAKQGLCPPTDAARVETHLKAVGLPTRIEQIPGPRPTVETLLTHIGQDKKVSRGSLTFILTRGIGKAFIARDVSPDAVKSFLTETIG